MEERYNLLEQSWIPTVNKKHINLCEVFSDKSITGLGGNPTQKISILKLVLAVAQRALDIKTEDQLYKLTEQVIVEKCLAYLKEHHDSFYLYGRKPFLQMTNISEARVKTFNEVSLEIATGNTSVVYCSQRKRDFEDKEIALLLLTLQSFAPGGKKTDNTLVLTPGYMGKQNAKGSPASSKAGPSLGFKGYLHSFLIGENLIDTIRLNLFSEETINAIEFFPNGMGVPPWEELPKGEDDEIAQKLKTSYMGRLIPMCRYMLLTDGGFHFTDGIMHPSIYEGSHDLSMSVDLSKKKPICLWTNPTFNHWKHFLPILSFLDEESEGIRCFQLQNGFKIAHKKQIPCNLWSGGLKISSKAGEQYCSGMDDYIEASVPISYDFITEEFYEKFKEYHEIMKKYEAKLYFCVRRYCEDLNISHESRCNKAKEIYGTSIDENLNALFDIIAEEDLKGFRRKVFKFVCVAYDSACPVTSETRILAWAKNNPTINNRGGKNGNSNG